MQNSNFKMQNDNSKLKFFFIDFFFLVGILLGLTFIVFDILRHKFDFDYLSKNFRDNYYDFPFSYLYADGFQFIISVIGFILILIGVIVWYKKSLRKNELKWTQRIIYLGILLPVAFLGVLIYFILAYMLAAGGFH